MPSSAPPTSLRFAVIGGGISGLAAAHRLHRLLPHATLRVFESSDRLGGPLHTLTDDEMSALRQACIDAVVAAHGAELRS